MARHKFKLGGRSLFLGAIALFWAIVLSAHATIATPKPTVAPPAAASIEQVLAKLPPPRPHPLPPTLAQSSTPSGDYFDQVQSTIVGALVWTNFPVTVYVQPETPADQANPFLQKRSQAWIAAAQRAVQEWNSILPLAIVTQPETADITIWRSTPPLRIESSKNTAGDRRLPIPRARSAETRYEFYAKSSPAPGQPAKLAHRMTIYIRPDQSADYLQAAARHELGHAIGIWGHSPNQSDALYFSQVRNPANISSRDINTLRRVYEQPTRLGWQMSH
ncbi:MAG: hypothetical protein NW224_21070 [Leptolyngbyaceae cyanobacterium bins.302]|nr:hypothetical protein [Leptolyngbyaceae cyanobacterium bins.302]